MTENHNIQTVAQLREAWVSFFKSKEHTHVPSASLIPKSDPTLLFTTAGMVQFKPYFAATEVPPYKRAVTVQKCFRTTDLESVGRTARHLTFFEMLGNFSFFNSYFKKEAIAFAWEFSTEWLRFDPEKIHVTVYTEDDEAEKIWNQQIGVPMERITRLGKKDNWWGPAGDSGACGPCSELYLDRGKEICTCEDKDACRPGSDCDRFMEYWNIVFNQYNQDTSGNLSPLPETGIDTGAGLERIIALKNNADSVYDTDELLHIIKKTESLIPTLRSDGASVIYKKDSLTPFRVLADHSRAVTFAIADGIFPDSTGRGYVIRRIIRRASLFARELGVNQPVLHKLVPEIINIYGDFYPELKKSAAAIESRILSEEERFHHTLEQGLRIFGHYTEELKEKKATVFPGEAAFRLYDTFGFPLEITRELAEAQGLETDIQGFEQLMEKQRETASQGARWKEWNFPNSFPADLISSATEFTGYDHFISEGRILSIIKDDHCTDSLTGSGKAILILDRTCFYGESGGQKGDTGKITKENSAVFIVKDTQKKGNLILHEGELISGSLKTGDTVKAETDQQRRKSLTGHHSATHLLNAALRRHLGDHIQQTGSLVAPDYLRFDFSHPEKVSPEILSETELQVNKAIRKKAPVTWKYMPIEEARKTGAVATFGEKYGETVRVVQMGGSETESVEFCGGCHVSNTSEIGLFHILKESSPGAGNRRIEAIAGEQVILHFQETIRELSSRIQEFNEKALASGAENLIIKADLPDDTGIRNQLESDPLETQKLSSLKESYENALRDGEKKLIKAKKADESSRASDLISLADDLISSAETAGSVSIIARIFRDEDPKLLRVLGDSIKEKKRNVLILFGSTGEKGPGLLFMANKDAVSAGINCGSLIKEAAPLIGGAGGGKPDMAQAGGKDPSGLEAAVSLAGQNAAKQVK